MPRCRLAGEIRRESAWVAPAVVGPMATDARHLTRRRPACIPEEFLTERDFLRRDRVVVRGGLRPQAAERPERGRGANPDRKSTRLNSSHGSISYAVFC